VRFTGGVEAQHRKLGTSSVAAACLRVQQERKQSSGPVSADPTYWECTMVVLGF
jgi:hypothetical protein